MNARGNESLSGKVAVVTGAGRGIGRAIALGFANAGAAVTCTARTVSQIDATASDILAQGGRAFAQACDVAEHAQVAELFTATIEKFGGVDIVIINAGAHFTPANVEDIGVDIWEQTIAINLRGVFLTAKTAIPYLRSRGGGHIIVVGSGVGRRGTSGSSAYACSKAGASMFVRVLAQELALASITVNELIPGPVETAMMGDGAEQFRQIMPQEWVKTPDDVVPLALFLATQPFRGPTGQSFSLARRDL